MYEFKKVKKSYADSIYTKLDGQVYDLDEPKKIAIAIFEEYLKKDAKNYISIPDLIICKIYKKFGCHLEEEDDNDNATNSNVGNSMIANTPECAK